MPQTPVFNRDSSALLSGPVPVRGYRQSLHIERVHYTRFPVRSDPKAGRGFMIGIPLLFIYTVDSRPMLAETGPAQPLQALRTWKRDWKDHLSKAMKTVELRRLTRRHLMILARAAGIPRRRRLKRNQLIAVLASAEGVPNAELPAEAELPETYGRICLTLMEVEPDLFYAYWEIPPPVRQALLRDSGRIDISGEWILRFHEIGEINTEGALGYGSFDVPVDLDAGNWYIRLGAASPTLLAEAGFRTTTGEFVPLCRSNTVNVLRAGHLPDPEPLWVRVEGAYAQVEVVPGPGPGPHATPGRAEEDPGSTPVAVAGSYDFPQPQPALVDSRPRRARAEGMSSFDLSGGKPHRRTRGGNQEVELNENLSS